MGPDSQTLEINSHICSSHRKNTGKPPKSPHTGGNWVCLPICANARGRSRDSAPRGQGGGSPPCTSCPENAHKQAPRSPSFATPGPTVYSEACASTQKPAQVHSGPRLKNRGKSRPDTCSTSRRVAKIAPERAHNGANWEQIRFWANATGRSRDSAPRGQGGGPPPCTSGPETAQMSVSMG